MVLMLRGWLPSNSRTVQRGESVYVGDHGEPGCTPRVRGLADLALCGRLSFSIVVTTKGLI